MVCKHSTRIPIHNNNSNYYYNDNDNDKVNDDTYNLTLHLLAVIIILVASSLGVLLPLIATKVHSSPYRQRLPTLVLTLGRQFGTGVILSTALIHMLPTAMSNLSSPCLGEFFSKDYPVLGGLIVLTSSLLMHWIEFMATEFTAPGMTRVTSSGGQQQAGKKPDPTDVVVSRCPGHVVTVTDLECRRDHGDQDQDSERALLLLPEQHSVVAPADQVSSSYSPADSRDTHDHHHRPESHPSVSSTFYGAISDTTLAARPLPPSPRSPASPRSPPEYQQSRRRHDHNHLPDQEAILFHSHLPGLTLPSDAQKRISTYILEAGVAAHSVIVGVTLGVSSGSEFIGLFIALLFHQFFEGFALGARIADLNYERSSTHLILALIFSLTTPIGTLMGIAISNTYQSDSVAALWTEGVLDAISTGILLYMGYVTLLAVEFNLNSELLRQSPRVKSWCFVALWAGAGVMALLGRFA